MEIRLLRENDIECRVAQVDKNLKWCSVLLYKNARVDMNVLDETFGPMNWQRHHEVIDGKLFCTVSVYDKNKNQWVSKQDVGVESNTEAEKGQASDAFKRACFNFGIGRELYTAPKIFVNLNQGDISNGKVRAHFNVKEIGYTGNSISSLTLVDDKGAVRYRLESPEETVARVSRATQKAFQDVERAQSAEELVAIFNRNVALQSNNEFINKLKLKKQELNERA